MIQFNLIILEIGLIISMVIFIFVYSLISSDLLVTIICFTIYLIFFVPLFLILEQFRLSLLDNLIFFDIYKIIRFICFSVYILIGLILFIELLYLIFFS